MCYVLSIYLRGPLPGRTSVYDVDVDIKIRLVLCGRASQAAVHVQLVISHAMPWSVPVRLARLLLAAVAAAAAAAGGVVASAAASSPASGSSSWDSDLVCIEEPQGGVTCR